MQMTNNANQFISKVTVCYSAAAVCSIDGRDCSNIGFFSEVLLPLA